MQKINELTTNKEQALQKKELVELNWQIERIKIIAGIEQEKTQKEINLLKGTIGKQPIFPWSQEFLRENGYTPENLARVEAAKKIIEAGIPGMDFLLS
jgi:hypothetical protein